MNLLVTGGAGFIGSHFVLRHVSKYPEDHVVVLDKLTYAGDRSFLDAMKDKIEFFQGDIADTAFVEQLVTKYAIETIVDFAAETHVDNSIADAGPFIHTNILGVQSLITVARAHPKMLLLHISTDEVYGDIKDGEPSCDLSSPLKPSNPYSATKAAGDLLILAAVRTYGIRARITRCSNNYGPHQASEKYLPTVIGSVFQGKKIPIYGKGQQKRDWLYVTDHTDGVELVLQKGKDGSIYLISADDERANIDTAKRVIEAMGASEDLISFIPDRPGHDWRYSLDSSSTRALGWKPQVSFEDGLKETIAWYTARLSKLS